MSGKMARAFLDDIVADPDDDAPRLVYADWLDENGQPERAEFIRVQISLSRLPEWDGARVRLTLREKALLKEHGEAWKAELPSIKGVKWGKFRRGFMATAKLAGFAALRSAADECWAAAPIEAIEIRWPRAEDRCETIPVIPRLREISTGSGTAMRGDADRLAAAPLLSTLRVLTVSGCELGNEGFRHIVTSPHLRGLRALRAAECSIGNGGLEALRSSRLELEELDLEVRPTEGYSGGDDGYYGDEDEVSVIDVTGVAALADWPGASRLRRLNLSGNNLRRVGLQALLLSSGLAGLKHLTLRSCGLTGDVGRDLYDATPALRLDVLDIAGNMLEGDVYGYLGRAACLDELKSLNLGRCEMPADETQRVAEASFIAGLRVLDLGHNTFSPGGVGELMARRPAALHTLKLRDTDIGDDGAAHIAESPASDALLELDIADNRLTDRAAAALAASEDLRSLVVLRLGGNRIGKPALEALAESDLGRRLVSLDLGKKEGA